MNDVERMISRFCSKPGTSLSKRSNISRFWISCSEAELSPLLRKAAKPAHEAWHT